MNEMINETRVCCCSLPYYNPDACKTCSAFVNYEYPSTTPYQQQWYPKIKNVKRVTKTIEKYDKNGKLIGKEVITKEYEDVEKEIWEPNQWVITYEYNTPSLGYSSSGQQQLACIN